MALSPNDFADPPWGAPLQTDRLIADISDDETIAGMFYLALMEGSKRRGVPLQFPRERYMQFSFYPLKEFARVLVQAARLFFPDRPVRQGLRILGALGPRAFATSTLGKVTLGAAADSMRPWGRSPRPTRSTSRGADAMWSTRAPRA
jgi:hypothetical protein